MIDSESHKLLKEELDKRISIDRRVLDTLRNEIKPLKNNVRKIQQRSITSVSLVGTDGGNNRFQFDPFLVHIIRVVDSSNNEYCLNAITPTTSTSQLSKDQFDSVGKPITPLGRLMEHLSIKDLAKLSHMIRNNDNDEPTSPTWVQVYRELVEWATLFDLIKNKNFGTDTLFVFDGLLRSKVFAKDNFKKYLDALAEAIELHKKNHRQIYLVGLAKHSKVLDRYRLAMSLEGVLATDYPSYVTVPRDIEEKAYIWSEYAKGDDLEQTGEINKFVGGKMFLVKFGVRSRDPIWPVDIFQPQEPEAQTIIGCLLADAINGFPIPFYPQCLQKAHENAALVDFDFDILQDQIFEAIRKSLNEDAPLLDEYQLRDNDVSDRRY
ncbi:hypothetical protein ACFLUO_07320 [Chloroflexota bacterium]